MSCPVTMECELYRKRTKSEFGVWAGKFWTRREVSESK